MTHKAGDLTLSVAINIGTLMATGGDQTKKLNLHPEWGIRVFSCIVLLYMKRTLVYHLHSCMFALQCSY